MNELLGLAYYAEIPAVVIDVQRVGPSTGMPTRTQQGDILECAYASHGDTKHILLFPANPAECFEFAVKSFDLAERFQTPVFMLSDLDIGMNDWVVPKLTWPDAEELGPHKWGMTIDLSRCTGCHACVAACQAENNIPIVGKDQVLHNRQMHWIRIDRYFKGAADDPNPEVVYQPLTCQQCENAPCEQVCPVGATMHDTEGLNVMVYNRCVGTRYCSNNCPYKVRRFNYLDFQSQDPRNDKYPKPWLNIPDQQQLMTVPKVKQMMFNPEVTVRMRGVMEKCSFCVQRIHTTTIAKRARNETLKDGDIMTACQQSCPTTAINFGDLSDLKSKVSIAQRDKRAYGLLDEELQTAPRNKYLAKVSNPIEA